MFQFSYFSLALQSKSKCFFFFFYKKAFWIALLLGACFILVGHAWFLFCQSLIFASDLFELDKLCFFYHSQLALGARSRCSRSKSTRGKKSGNMKMRLEYETQTALKRFMTDSNSPMDLWVGELKFLNS